MPSYAAARTASVAVGLLMGLGACSGDDRHTDQPPQVDREPPRASVPVAPSPQHKVKVRLTDIRATEGSLVAGVLYVVKSVTDIRDTNAVGGFGVEVDHDPLSGVAAVRTGSRGYIPHVEGPAVDVDPGTYTLVMWRGPTLGGYSKWLPAAEPGLTACPVQVVVGDEAVTTVTVAGFPRQPKPLDLETMRPCLQ